MQRTLAIIKPDAVQNKYIGNIISSIESSGFVISGLKLVRMTTNQACAFYAVHQGKYFFDGLVSFMSSGPIVVLVLEAESAIHKWRDLIGDTDPAKAADGTIRHRFGTATSRNVCHGSDNEDNAQKEIAFFFSDKELIH